MAKEHPVVTYFEKEKSIQAITGFFVFGVVSYFLWITDFPFFSEYWGISSFVGFLMAVILGVIHYFKFEHKNH